MLGSLLHPTSYLGFFVFIAATGCGLPIPEEAAIVIAGVLSAQGHLVPGIAFAACLAGAVVGDSFMYAIGYHWGHGLFTSHPRFAKLLAEENEEQFQQAIDSHALKVMLLARFLVGVRAPVYLMTGALRMPYRRFLVYDIISASAVVGVVFSLSYVFGDNVREWVRHTEFYATLVVAGVILLVGGIVYYRNRAAVFEFIFGTHEASSAERQPSASSRENP
jgi:membrane protein DedA with SNARE-associated domain